MGEDSWDGSYTNEDGTSFDQTNWGDDSGYTGDQNGFGWNGEGQDANGWSGSNFMDNFSLDNLMKYGSQAAKFFGGSSPNQQGTGGNNAPRTMGGDLGATLLGMLGSRAQQGTFKTAWDNMLNADPFNKQTPMYQGMLQNVLTNGIGDTPYGKSIASSVGRMDSAKGYNMSGNMLHDIAKGLDQGSQGMAGVLTPLAMGRAPDLRGLAPIATGAAGAQGGMYAGAGYGLGTLLNGMGNTNLGNTPNTGNNTPNMGSNAPVGNGLYL